MSNRNILLNIVRDIGWPTVSTQNHFCMQFVIELKCNTYIAVHTQKRDTFDNCYTTVRLPWFLFFNITQCAYDSFIHR